MENKRKRRVKYKTKKPGALKVASFLLFFGALGYAGYLYETEYKPTSKRKNKPAIQKLISVKITGAVKKPGTYRVFYDSNLSDLIKISGGLTEKADRDNINYNYKLRPGAVIEIPKKKGLFGKLGIGSAPEETYLKPPIEVEESR